MARSRVANEGRGRGGEIDRANNGKECMYDGRWRGIDGGRCVGLTSEVMNMPTQQGALGNARVGRGQACWYVT